MIFLKDEKNTSEWEWFERNALRGAFSLFFAFKESESVIAFAEYNTIHTLVVMELKKKMGEILCQTQNRFQKLQLVQKRNKSFWND